MRRDIPIFVACVLFFVLMVILVGTLWYVTADHNTYDLYCNSKYGESGTVFKSVSTIYYDESGYIVFKSMDGTRQMTNMECTAKEVK